MRLKKLVKEIFKKKFPPKRVLFRVDAGSIEGLSFGHLSRCLILAKELKRSADSEVIFLMRDYKEGIAFARSSEWGLQPIDASLSKKEHDKSVIKFTTDVKPDCLVVDLPDENPSIYLKHARKNQILTICIDDTAKLSYASDIILNSSILADRKKYGECLPTARFLLGTDYFIMDDYVAKKKGVQKDSPFSVKITFGGSDPKGLTENVVNTLAEHNWSNVQFTVILGPGFKDKNSVIRASRPLNEKIEIIDNPNDMNKIFLEADLVICAGGRTLYELNKIGVPCVAIATSKNEALVINKFIEEDLLFYGFENWNKRIFIKQLKSAILLLYKR